MKVLKYLFNNCPIEMTWNETNEEIAKKEADNGEYTIEDVETDTTDEAIW
jgi:hypothetical protein